MTARLFATTVPTVHKWLRRYQQQGLRGGLQEHSCAYHSCSHKTPPELEQHVVELRRELPTFGAARLRRILKFQPQDAVTHQWYGLLLAEQAEFSEAIAQARKAQSIDPVSVSIRGNLASHRSSFRREIR